MHHDVIFVFEDAPHVYAEMNNLDLYLQSNFDMLLEDLSESQLSRVLQRLAPTDIRLVRSELYGERRSPIVQEANVNTMHSVTSEAL